MSAYPKPATPVPWSKSSVVPIGIDDIPYVIRAANAFPHLVAALELIMAEDWDAFRIAKHALAIARGEATP